MTGLNKKLLSLMKCPICYGLLRPPFYLCENGHGICNKCLPKVHQKKCATCRGRMLKNRCLLLEDVFNELQVPCKNKEIGCNFVANAKIVSNHICEFEINKCPLNIEGCKWKGFRSGLVGHMLEDHEMEYESIYLSCPFSTIQCCEWLGPLFMFAKHIIENHTSTITNI